MKTTRSIAWAFSLLAFSVGPTDLAYAEGKAKKPLDHDVYDHWKSIQGQAISDDGKWVLYSVAPRQGDGNLQVKNLTSEVSYTIPRGTSGQFTEDSHFVVFRIKPEYEAVKKARREHKKPEEQPKDFLGILDLRSGKLARIERVKSFRLPSEGAGPAAYLLEKVPAKPEQKADDEKGPEGKESEQQQGLAQKNENQAKRKEKEPGTVLVLRNLETAQEHRYRDVTDYTFSNSGDQLAYAASSEDGSSDAVYVVKVADGSSSAIMKGEGIYKAIAWDKAGVQLSFLSNQADFAADQPAFALMHWRLGTSAAEVVAKSGTAGIPQGWWISENESPRFSDTGNRLFFGTAPRPKPEPQESTPDDEQVKVDIWNWKDPYLQPMQLVQLQQERRRTYQAVVHLGDSKVVQLATLDVPSVTVGAKGDADVAIAISNLPYRQLVSWDSPGYHDVYLIDVATGERRSILQKVQSRPRLSPQAKYVVWWDPQAVAWFAIDVASDRVVNLTERIGHAVHNELHDQPSLPRAYGSAGWTQGDAAFLVYDKHDIWATDPTEVWAPRNITEGMGRRQNLRLRYIRLDSEADAIDPEEPMLLRSFHLHDKSAGFHRDQVQGHRKPEQLIMIAKSFSTPRKAQDADVLLVTRSCYREFPDLWVSDLDFKDPRKLSNANPQQADYLWGTAELVGWRSADGVPLQGVLHKPENFDPDRKYPMIVYFYERLSDTIHRHRAPGPSRSSVNTAFYVSRGYLVFTPDIPYTVGYPGQSALNAVVPGVLSLISKGFVDEQNVGVQGHSWGGYQIAYLVTRTNIFKAAEAGAPVSNMISAYGGIRWQSGRSRMFQYEETQSRIGGSLWEYPTRFIENSPIFWVDKIETPLLMMHNDQDGAVPWYQGIEMFVALRRLGKPAWLINYNGEAHGLRKYQNQKDWAVRLQQFFDHYLKGAPPPVWLANCVPALQKGKTLGLELVEEQGKATDQKPHRP